MICTPVSPESILRVFICGQMSSASSHRLACGWICSVWCRVFFSKMLQLSLAESCGPSKPIGKLALFLFPHLWCKRRPGFVFTCPDQAHVAQFNVMNISFCQDFFILHQIITDYLNSGNTVQGRRQSCQVHFLIRECRQLSNLAEGGLQACWPKSSVEAKFQLHGFRIGMGNSTQDWMSLTFSQVQRDLLCVQKSHLFNRTFNCCSLQRKPCVWLVFVSSPASSFKIGRVFDLLWHLFGQGPAAHLLLANAPIPLQCRIQDGQLSA